MLLIIEPNTDRPASSHLMQAVTTFCESEGLKYDHCDRRFTLSDLKKMQACAIASRFFIDLGNNDAIDDLSKVHVSLLDEGYNPYV